MSDSCFSHASLNHGRGEEWPVEELVDSDGNSNRGVG